ncbi:MAG: glycosyltransferase family 4 protein [Patescibacteria group bacterium]
MAKNILIINSGEEKEKLLIDLFIELNQKEYNFFLLSSKPAILEQFWEKNWPGKKINLGPTLKNKFYLFIFILLLPWLCCNLLIILLNYKFNKQITAIILLDWQEKILATTMAKIIGLKIVWIEKPNHSYQNFKLKKLYKLLSNLAAIVVFNSDNKTQLKNFGFKEKNILFIQPAIKSIQYQENIFNKIAQTEGKNFHYRYFTVGAIANLEQKQKIEILFQAIKICLTIAPNLRLIIVGDGNERKNLSWIAKKMEIDALVWLIGEQTQVRKWLDSFDVYIATAESPDLEDYYNILEAMTARLPIIGPRNVGLENIILENKTGLLIAGNNSEMLALQIIKLYKDKKLRQQLGANGQKHIQQFFTLDKIVDKFATLL